MEKKFPTARLNSAQSDAAQARAMAHARPPIARAIIPVSATIAAPANAGRRRIAQEQLAQSEKENRQRRLIDVPKIEMARTGQVIKLIAKITVAPVCQQMD
jgi:hypothetical protein